MRALVTGATGFVGRHLAPALREAGWRVTTLGRRGPADRVGDLRTMPLRGLRADVVFHLAGFSNPSASTAAPEEAYGSNAAATARVAREVPAGRFLYVSSCRVYGPADRTLDEAAPCRPQTPYAASKLCGEALARGAARDVVVLRPFNHTGPGQSPDYVCAAIARRVALARAGLGPASFRLEGNLSARLDILDVRDVVRAYLLAAERGRAGAVYNVASGRPVSIRRIADLFARIAGLPLRIGGRSGPATLLSGDASALRRDTGWAPRVPLLQTLLDMIK